MSSALSPSDLGEEACQGNIDDFLNSGDPFLTNQSSTLTGLRNDIVYGNDSITMVSQDGFDVTKSIKTIVETADGEHRNLCAPGSDVNSPRDIVSPSAGSSDFSAMESDGEGIETGLDDASLSGIGDMSFQRSNGYYGASTPLEYTTTPCASSSACDDEYESPGSRKKRRRTRREMPHPSYNPTQVNGGLASLRFARATTQEPWQHDPETSPFSPPTCTKSMNFNFAENSSRRSSGGGSATAQITRTDNGDENAKRPRTCNDSLNGDDILNIGNAAVKLEMPTAMDTPIITTKSGTRRHHTHSHHRNAGPAEVEQILHKQYTRKIASYELRIVTQPESQHRARYLTEGSRGPVKDSAQRGFPEVELVGYDGPATLEVFVATDSGKVKPHGFYQACRVTGRNTSACEELEIEGTKVIKIPFKQDSMLLSIDCVGILKLRNTDVEVRTGIRNQKRNQSVRLAFRVSFSPDSGDNSVVLQTSSSRISCTQPLGQPEITKKSVDRCSVEGGIEMFIIGKNFHRGTKVLYQDPEDPDGKQWCAEGDVDKDTFHQSHMVVRVPPYHDQEILKPVNVQLSVEFQDKSCEPHSFTYIPRQKEPEATKDDPKKTLQTQANIETSNIESALNLLDGAIDKKFLVALFSKLLTGGMTRQPDSPGTSDAPEQPAKTEPQTQPAMVNAATVTNPHSLINGAAAPLLQGLVQPQLQTQTVVKVAPSEPLKSAVNFVNPSPTSVPITSNQFTNVRFNLQASEMSFTQELNSAGPPPASSATPVVSPVSQMIFNPATSTVITLPVSNANFNPTLYAGIANPAPVSQINSNPPINGGLSTSVFPSVGGLPAVFAGSNFKIKSEMPLPETMPNVTLSPNIQTIPIMASTTSRQPAFRDVTQALPTLVGYAVPAQDPTPPFVVTPVSQTQLGQGGILYDSFSATLTNAASMFGSASAVSFAGDTLTKINQSSGNAFANVSVVQGHLGSPSLPQAVVFADSGITSTPAQQMQTQPAPNFQESPGQQMQQQHILATVSASQVFINQSQPQFVTNTSPVSHNPGNMVQNPISVATFVPTQMLLCPDSMQQVTTSFESPFVDKKPNQYTIEANQNSKVQSPNESSSQQFSSPASRQHLQQQLTNFGSQNQQQFGISVQEQPMQQDQHGSVTGQKEPQHNQQSVGFGVSNQHHFTTVVEDHHMPLQQPIAVTQQQFSIGSQTQQNPVFNNHTQHFSVGLQDPIQQQPQVLPSAQSEISHQSFPVAPQDQTLTQQQPVTQIVHVQQVVQSTSNAAQSQDTQMHVDPFVEPRATGNLQAQSTNNAFNIQQTVIPSVIQPIEEMSQPTNTNRTSDRHMKDLLPPQVQQQQQQQSFYIQHQAASMPVASEIVGPQTFHSQQPVAIAPAAISMQPVLPASALNAQDFQNIQQPVNASIVAAQEQNFAAPPQVHSPNAPVQNGVLAASMPPLIFQNQPTGQNMETEGSNSAPMPARQYQSPEAVTKSPLLVAAPDAAQGYQTVQASATNSAQMQMYKRDYAYQDSSTAQIQQQGDVRTQREGNATLQSQQTLDANSTVRQFEQRSLDLFAMTQLLQSIDGSANLEAITGEDVQRHCQ